MSKYDNKHFVQLNREIFKADNLSNGAKWLFVVLKEQEHIFCTENKDEFYRTDEDLARDAGYSLKTLKKHKRELKLNATNLLSIEAKSVYDTTLQQHTKKKVTYYCIF